MTTNIEKIRFIIDDKSSEDFTDDEIQYFLDEENSINYAVYNLAKMLIVRLRKEILIKSDTGIESETLAPLRERLEILKEIYSNYKNKYEAENNNTTGIYIATVKPTIAGGDI